MKQRLSPTARRDKRTRDLRYANTRDREIKRAEKEKELTKYRIERQSRNVQNVLSMYK